ncbi:hypothetical protein Tco_0453501 [Tanacetum coccineum]
MFHAWMNGNWDKRRIDDSILRSNNTTTESFFKPYLITHGKSDTEKEDEHSQTSANLARQSNLLMSNLTKEGAKQKSSKLFSTHIFRKRTKDGRTLEAKNIDEYWWRIYKSGDLEVLESGNFKVAVQHNLANKLNMENLSSKY